MTKARVNADNASADIQGVTAGTGLTGGGTSGTVSLAVDTTTIQTRVANVSDTEIGYLDGVTSAIQTQLNQKPEFVAGKNKIINGAFDIWQRGTSFTNPASDTGFTADRWYTVWNGTGATRTITQQAFTPGTAPVAGYEGTYFFRYNQSVAGTGNTYNYITTSLEDVRTFANQVVTLSFWAKASASSSIQNVQIDQNFGSGGSAINYNALSSGVTSFSLTTSWQRFSVTGTLASISGKTIGTGSYLRLFLALPAGVTSTIDIWGVQLEAGSVSTPFQTATGNLESELAACQRYYWRWTASATYSPALFGGFYSTSQAKLIINTPVTLRTAPTTLDYGGTFRLTDQTNYSDISGMSLVVSTETSTSPQIIATASAASFANYRPAWLTASNSSTAYLGVSAEL